MRSGIACCDVINRGAFYADGKIVYNLLDGHTVAVDAATGKEIWKTKVADLAAGETTPMAPLVVKDRVIVGPSGGEFGIHGWVKGLDLGTGQGGLDGAQRGSRRRGAGPARHLQAVLRPAATSWPSGAGRTALETGGAPVWGWMSYDPELDLVYYGVGNPVTLQRRAAPGRQQVDRQRAGAPPGRRRAGLGLPVHPARQLGLRRRRRDDPGGRQDRRPGAQGAGHTSTRTASRTRSTAPPARCSRRRRTCR